MALAHLDTAAGFKICCADFSEIGSGNSTSVKERKVHIAMSFSISRFIEITVSKTR
jgi:hypothetical protein